ncbi:hypothetical protein AJ85_11810 [Alkalihalobacillus alcalophilus ATCC 27647 = CGMCC 1.3604]|uniref:S58 family peptidase n=1 Tax=Alkalihalobacillus alcalophilus ATCC 27647 = CGMCC 1.3604 TaxID=1218173 RepID=A0A4S4JYC3_ALKAL|nr:hypothetical protein AJ85_11810 [Alkalihalobacillus alcalophilus ATCC 27647 = CGMCC 1.3604]
MHNQKKIRDYGIKIGQLEPGYRNAITDVEGVSVGHVTLSNDNKQTGVTAICHIKEIPFMKSLSPQAM